MKSEVSLNGVRRGPSVDAGAAAHLRDNRRAWTTPSITLLPRLTELTLQSIPCGGEPGGGGGTVCP